MRIILVDLLEITEQPVYADQRRVYNVLFNLSTVRYDKNVHNQ